jgi:hypothetical protein
MDLKKVLEPGPYALGNLANRLPDFMLANLVGDGWRICLENAVDPLRE